jgi:prevent-host-death family protein
VRWQLQQAKARLSELVKYAANDGPQTITVHGKAAAVLLSAEAYDALTATKPRFTDYLLSGPAWEDVLVEAINDRPRDAARDIDF